MTQRPTVAEVLADPRYKQTLFKLTPTKSGRLPVAKDRGGPVDIEWELHGHGDIKLVWIMGLGSIKTAWQRQTLKYGHTRGSQYSSLIFDNRGMGGSSKPLMRYTTLDMAKDLIELLDHLGWTGKRELHVSGVSMGGMIAQELGLLIPDRISSLNLISTAAVIENNTSFIQNLRTRINMFIPKSLDRSVADAAISLFSHQWLEKPDDSTLPTKDTPGAVMPPSGKYESYPTNYHRFAAIEVSKRTDAAAEERFPKLGFVLQAIAAGWHYKSPAQLKELGDKVGRERIMVLHGTGDNMIPVISGQRLIEWLQPSVSLVKDGTGHVFMLEEQELHDGMIEKQIEKTRALNEK